MRGALRSTVLVVATLTISGFTLLAVVVGFGAALGGSDADAAPAAQEVADVLAQEGDNDPLDATENGDAVEESDVELNELTISYELILGRDPFETIRPEPEPEIETPVVPTDPTLPGVPTDPDDPTAPVDPADPTRPADPSRPADPADPSRPADPAAPDAVCTDEVDGVCQGKRLELVEILDDDSARLRVEGASFDVDEGDRFAEDFVLLEVSGNCVIVLFADGDETQRFRLCEPTAK